MENLPVYISVVFVCTTLLTLFFFYKSSTSPRPLLVILVWLVLQSVVSLTGFYTYTRGVPPRFTLLLVPPVIVIITLFLTKTGQRLIDNLNVMMLTLLHIVRIPVELTLYWLFLHKTLPEVMTFDGRNFDILCGITAPLVYYFGYVKKVLTRNILIAWNVTCLLLLANIVVLAVLSGPFAFQKLGFNKPNIALLYFPFTWLPCCIVPIVLFAHLASLKQLMTQGKYATNPKRDDLQKENMQVG